ncbi:hypothetical protein FACS189447_02260 [Spirochaetia bacterium]|nr:hypothetical protein FACS189447_02260 [Spirochaetia bacterium]
MNMSRRTFLKSTGAAAAAATLAPQILSCVSEAPANTASAVIPAGKPVTIDECRSLTPKTMAESSPLIRQSWNYLNQQIGSIKNANLRRLAQDIYADSTPSFIRFDAARRNEIWKTLSAAGYTKQSESELFPPIPSDIRQSVPYIAAPGSGYQSHHAYPGGLVTHVAANVLITNAVVDTYINTYGYEVDRDTAVTAQLLHDLHKPWVFQWQEDAACRGEPSLAGAGEHHVWSLAELLVRNAPADLVVAQACAHTHPGASADEQQIVGWLKAAAIIGGVDPVNYGLLAPGGNTVPLPRKQEGFICHLGDHDYVLSVPAVQWTLPVLQRIAAADFRFSDADLKGKPFNSLRNYIYANYSAMRLEQDYATGGEEAVRRAVRSLIIA